jgi:hypothetical protein
MRKIESHFREDGKRLGGVVISGNALGASSEP